MIYDFVWPSVKNDHSTNYICTYFSYIVNYTNLPNILLSMFCVFFMNKTQLSTLHMIKKLTGKLDHDIVWLFNLYCLLYLFANYISM